MTEAASFAFMQARIQARHGDRLTADQWRQLDTCRDLGRFLQLARSSDLGKWARHFASHEDPGQWERSLRTDWRRNLTQLADWVPQRWRPSMLWLRSLPALPLISHVMNGEKPPAWVSADPLFAEFDLSDVEAFRDSMIDSDWSPLLDAWSPERPVETWFAAWRSTWPRGDRKTAQELQHACDELATSWREPDADHAHWHDSLEKQFTAMLRRRPRTILAMLGHVGLVSLDMLHLRAGLLRLHVSAKRRENEP